MKRFYKLVGAMLVPVMLGGCVNVSRIRPIVDMQASPSSGQRDYETDLAECQQYAASIDTGENAVAGAVVGALLLGAMGAAMGASLGNAGAGAAAGATAGGIGGGAGGMAGAEQRKVAIVNNCLSGRGWNVL